MKSPILNARKATQICVNKLHSHTQRVETWETDLLKYILKTVLCPYGTFSAFKLNQTGDMICLLCYAFNFQAMCSWQMRGMHEFRNVGICQKDLEDLDISEILKDQYSLSCKRKRRENSLAKMLLQSCEDGHMLTEALCFHQQLLGLPTPSS